jgi:N utilization substance protein B
MDSFNMRKRTKAREFALQILYEIDITHDDYAICLEVFWNAHLEDNIEEEVKKFTTELIKGVTENLEIINEKISRYANNWELKRMAVVDRNVLRISCYELMFCDDIPAKVSINEAIELAKKYSNPEAGKFVNGILDKIKLEKNK